MCLFKNESQKFKKKNFKSFIFMRNLSCNFATEQCSSALTQWCVNPKEMKGWNAKVHQMRDRKGPIGASSFAKNGHEPL
jgi:hypothetical protein